MNKAANEHLDEPEDSAIGEQDQCYTVNKLSTILGAAREDN